MGKESAIVQFMEEQTVETELSPLLRGQSVLLKMKEVSKPLPKRYSSPLLLVVPETAVGQSGRGIYVGIAGMKLEYMTPGEIKKSTLWGMGFTARAAKAFIDEVNRTYGEVKNDGNEVKQEKNSR